MSPFPDDEDIEDAMIRLEAGGFPTRETVAYAETLVEVGVGPKAEDAVRTIVAVLPEATIEDLVQRHVIGAPARRLGICDQDRARLLAARLGQRGFSVGSGWTVTWDGGPVLEAATLCPLALLAVWLRRMRRPPGQKSFY